MYISVSYGNKKKQEMKINTQFSIFLKFCLELYLFLLDPFLIPNFSQDS